MKKESKSSTQKRPEILIAEDSLTQATQIKHLLESNHYKVSVAQNGKQAMDRLSKHKPSLVISDILMPEMNGYELCKRIKSNKKTANIPVILLTRLSGPEEIIEGLSCGADSFITKPFNDKYLLSHIEKILSEEDTGDYEKFFFDTQIYFMGKKRLIQAEQKSVVKLMLSIYEGAIHQNIKLLQTQEELRLLNERLESLVEDRTSDLKEEIKLSNQIAEKLKKSEEKYHRIFENVLDMYYETSIEGTIIDVSPSIEILSKGQYHRDDLIGKSIYDFYSDIDDRTTLISQIKERGTVSDYEIILKNRDSSLVPCSISSKICLDAQGHPEKIIGSMRDITERKQAENALRESEEKYRLLIDTANESIIVGQDGLLKFVNNITLELLEVSSEQELIDKPFPEFIHPDDRKMVVENYRRRIGNEGVQQRYAFRVVTRKGIVRWVEINAVLIEWLGKPATLNFLSDITERKRTDEVLKESESSLRDAQEIAKMGSWEWDMVKQKTNWSDNYYSILGFNPGEVEPGFEFFRNRIHPDDVHFLDEIQANILKYKTPSDHELRLIQTDGTVKWIQNYISPVIEDNKLVRLKGVIIDITERKLAEEALRESEEKYRSIFENVQDVYYETSINGTILEISPSIEILSKGQYKMDDLIGKSMFDFYSEPKERQVLLEVLREKGTVTDFEITLKNRDSSHIPCSISSKICFDAQGHPEKIISSLHDITDRKNATEKLKLAKEKAEASDKLKTTFLNNISHEVRTPLNGILGFAEIMSQTDLSEEEKRVSLSMLFDSSDRLLNTITNYMDISLITSGTMSIYKKDFSPEQVLREIFPKNKMLCSLKNLDLFLNIPEQTENISISSDADILRKLFYHLLSNAIKFTEKGRIEYGYSIHKDELEFFVKDTGIGIGKESLNNVFEHFVKEDRGPLKITEGSGLGLSISKGFVELLGGKIRVDSEKGKGSAFFFTIPNDRKPENQTKIPAAGRQKKSLKNNPILVAEDDETNFYYLNALLKQTTSAVIIHALNGKEAIEKFLQNPDIGLILMDIKMPVMDGLEATRQIKAINRNIPVIAITAYAMAGDEARIADAGCDYYLTKPIDKKLLFEKITEFIEI